MPTGRATSISRTIALFGPPMSSKSRSCISSGRGLAGTSPSCRATSRLTIQLGVPSWSLRGRSSDPSTSLLLRRSKIPSNARFRGRVVPAYSSQCAICTLKEIRLLDAAHILGDVESGGEPTVRNGLSLCSIHHRAFDQSLVGVSPDYTVHVSRRLLEDEDGPMLDLLKGFHNIPLHMPVREPDRPDRKR
ncbi:MAG: hypothetical protein E6F94_13345, partial [Actinobacteria bacterium]